jgi:hypothetical protein
MRSFDPHDYPGLKTDPVVRRYLQDWRNLNMAIAHGGRQREEELGEWLDFLDTWLTPLQRAYIKSQAHTVPGTFECPYE